MMTRAKPSALVPRPPGESLSHVSRRRGLFLGPQYQVANGAVTVEARQATGVSVAIIDGPYDAAALFGILAQAPFDLGTASCQANPNSACDHGTFIVGLLGARQNALIPGLCPSCKLLHVPLFINGNSPSADVGQLANAIRVAVAAGARFINLSLAILGDDSRHDRELADSLDYAEANDVVVVAAAGNQGRLAIGQLLSHPVTIPVVAIDAAGRPLPENNFGPTISQRGIAALGHQVVGYAPRTGTTVMSGTSVATAVATATLVQLWSMRPDASAEEIRRAVAQLEPRNLSIPPQLDRSVLLMTLDRMRGFEGAMPSPAVLGKVNRVSLQGEMTMNLGHGPPRFPNETPVALSAQAATPANGSSECACGSDGGVCTCIGNRGRRSGFVYAIGTIEVEYPNVSIEREMQALAHDMGLEIEPDMDMPMKLTEDRNWQHAVLSTDRARYLARQLSWRLTIVDYPALVLNPRDPRDFDQLIDCLKREKFPKRERVGGKRKKGEPKPQPDLREPMFERPLDLDVVIGVAGVQTLHGNEVTMDQVFTIKADQLNLPGSGGYFGQLADNYGLTDEDRAYNYLIARYAIPSASLDQIDKEFELAGVPTIYSRLGGDNRRVVRVIYTFNGKGPNAPIQRRYFVRVDVTDEFPFIVTSWKPYLERGEQS